MFTRFFRNRKDRLTKFCEHVTPRMMDDASSDDVKSFNRNLSVTSFGRNLLASRVIATIGQAAWASFIDDAEHPKRSFILGMTILMAAADFWKSRSKPNEIYSAIPGSKNLIRQINSDIAVTEASLFILHRFMYLVCDAVKKGELVEADKDACVEASEVMCLIIQATTNCAIREIYSSRLNEYSDRPGKENPIESFVRVLLRSVGKQRIGDPDRRLDSPPLTFDQPLMMASTNLYMAAMLPKFFEVYSNVVHNYPMD